VKLRTFQNEQYERVTEDDKVFSSREFEENVKIKETQSRLEETSKNRSLLCEMKER